VSRGSGVRAGGGRSLLVGLVCCLAGPVCSPAAGLAEGVSSGGAATSSPLAGSLVVAGGLEEGQQAQSAEEARHSSPEAVEARQASQTSDEGLDAEEAAKLARESFPGVVDQPAGGLPRLPEGQRITDIVSADAAQVDLGGGGRGVVESLEPFATGSPRHWAPVDLGVSEVGGLFTVANPVVGLGIPKRLQEGVSLAGSGVSLTPADGSGAAVGGSEGQVDGSVVFYGGVGVGTDVDEIVKPTTDGFGEDAILRSDLSPERLFYRVGMPAGASLVPARDGSVAVDVVDAGTVIAVVLAPSAQDATGTSVPVSMAVEGDVLQLTVDRGLGEYQLPIEVDPSINDEQLATTGGGKRTNWEFQTSSEAKFGHREVYESPGKEYLETTGISEYKAGEVAIWEYQTKGNSKIYEVTGETEGKNKGDKIESFLELESHGSSQENKEELSNEFSNPEYSRKAFSPICPKKEDKGEQECVSSAGGGGNAIHFQQSATAAGSKFSDTLNAGSVSISEPSGTHSTTKFNTTSTEVEGEVEEGGKKVKQKRPNALYGAGGWLSDYQDALEPIAEDKGIGVADTRMEYESSPGKWEQLSEHNYLEKENGCHGVQCYEKHSEYWTVDPKLPNGEDKIRYRAEEAIHETESTEAEGQETVKVDTAPPHNLALRGLPYGNELSERPYALTVEAIDGEGTTVASSGIRSIALYVDKKELSKVAASCSVPKGACTASAKWTINGAELGAGHHAIEILTFDNAGNEARRELTISVRHSTPVALGPGSVDLESGDFSLGATDVSMGSGLTVSRNYSSRDLTQGDEGPLGPQWNLSMANTESLVELVDGSVLMTAANGGQSIFAAILNSEGAPTGQFEAPVGDSNLELKLEENKETKQKLAYYLKDASAGTSVKFTLPSGGTKVWVPTRQEGAVATDTVTYAYQTVEQHTEYSLPSGSWPQSITPGPEGDLWFTDYNSGMIGKITPWGTTTEYYVGPSNNPYGITLGPDGNLWFTMESTSKIGKITPAGVITTYSLPTKSNPHGITAGPKGEAALWFTDANTSKIAKITTSGTITEYSLPSGRTPSWITTGPSGEAALWFTDSASTSKIGKITTSGAITEYTLPVGSDPNQITVGSDKNLWFTEGGGSKVGKITTSGTITEYSVPYGSTPEGITAGPDGNLWFTENAKGKVGKITISGTITEYSVPLAGVPSGIAVGPEGNLWFTDYGTNKIGMITTSGTVTEPTEALAPVPAGVECGSTLETMHPGCRALKFKYASETKATGEGESGWGEYKGRLTKVSLAAYNPSAKKMQETPVAEYNYDKQGRLRAEWDPRISPELKTTYGYDEEGHVTALSPPGQEPWTFTYAPIQGDSGTGRLLKATRAQPPASKEEAESKLKEQEEPETNTEAPKITGSPVVGVRLAVSNGKWSGSPVVYGYQWEDCKQSGGGCQPIAGATNSNYTPSESDVGCTLIVRFSATNGNGSAQVVTAATGVVNWTMPPVYAGSLTESGYSHDVALDPKGDAWVSATSNNQIEELNGKRTVFGSSGSGAGQLKAPEGLAIDSKGDIWVAEYSNNRVQEFNEKGEFILTFGWGVSNGEAKFEVCTGSCRAGTTGSGNGQMSGPTGVALDPQGDIWVVDRGNNRVEEFGSKEEYLRQVGTKGKGNGQFEYPRNIAANAKGNVWVVDESNRRIQELNEKAEYVRQVKTEGFGGYPVGITVDAHNDVWVAETTGPVEEFNEAGEYISQFGKHGEYEETEAEHISNANGVAVGANAVWVADEEHRVEDWSTATAATEGEYRAPQPGYTLDYNVPVSGGGAPHNMSASEVAKWGQTNGEAPVEATAIFPPDEPQSWPASSYKRATIYYLDENGRMVNTAVPSTSSYGAISTTEYNETNDVIRTLSPANRVTALEAGSKSVEVSKLLDTQSTYNGEGTKEKEVPEPGTKLIETLGPQHMIKYVAGKETKESLARNHMKYFYNEGAKEVEEKTHETYNLLTKTTDLAQLANEEEVEVRKTTTSYSGQENLGWKLRAPTSTTVDPEGKKLTHTTLYNKTTAQITETRGPEGSSGESPHDGKIIYYSAAANTEGYAGCGGHPEWAGLVCETLPAKQPETSGPPNPPKLPVTTVTYNMWNEPETTTEAFGSTTRTKTETYDATGRLTGSETTSTSATDKSLPKVTNEYNTKTGALEVQSTTTEGKTKSVTSVHNTLGQLESYKDADGNTTKYKYGGPEIDNQVEEVSDNQGKQLYSYEETTKALNKLWVSGGTEGLTFTAAYNVEGKMTSETYPNGMCANYTYNSVGEATGIEYIKTTNCAESKPTVWYSQSTMSSIRDQMFSQESTLGSESYTYDTAERLTETQETPAGEGCKARIYAYDEESNRTSLTVREPNSKKECTTEGGTIEKHTYDEANRLTDTGIEYDSLGNVTKLSAADAGEGGELKSTFYVDNAVATQSQNGKAISYEQDPTGRVRRTISENEATKTKTTTISHYDAPGEAPAWTSEEGTEKWTRNIPGIDGSLSAIESSGSSAVLQLHDLQGDTVATAALSSSETKLLSTYNSTEFGVPNSGKPPPKYAFQGADGATSELGTGIITYGATSYVPQTGRALQSEEVEPPGAPGGSGAGAPVDFQAEPWNMQGALREGAEAPGLEAGREREAAEAACRANPETACALAYEGDPAWVWHLTIGQAQEIVGAIYAVKGWSYRNIANDLKGVLGIDFVKQFENYVIKTITGFSPDEIEAWAYSLGEGLEECVGEATFGYDKPSNPHCWVYIPTNLYHVEVPFTGIVLYQFELPNFRRAPEVAYCPHGESNCYSV
jgi:streptogramin lyase